MKQTSSIKKHVKDQICFTVRLDWLEKKRALVTSNDVKDTIHIAMPPVFGGEGSEWSPEHLCVGAIAGCFMNTYLYYAERMECGISHFVCEANGEIALSKGKYVFTKITIFPKIYIADEAFRDKAKKALEKATANSLVANSSKAEFICQAEILHDRHPKFA